MELTVSLQPKQREAYQKSLSTPVLFYGGSKGGGKSYLVRARELLRRLQYPNTHGLIVRKTYPELLSNHIRKFFQEYPITRDWYNKAEKTIYWPNGSTTEFSYLQNTDDVYTYQGREYEDISIDEITQHEEEVFKILRSSLRSSNREFTAKGKPTIFLTGNPGGIGMQWVKRIFLDRSFGENERPDDYGFVQATVKDNKALLDADPEYIQRLMDLPEDKRRAYLDGDWDVFTGQVFSEFSRLKHVITPLVPKVGDVYLSLDWGYSEKSAFSCHLHSVIKMKTEDGQNFQRVLTFKEWYGNQKTPHEWAEIIYKDCILLGIKPVKGYADPAIFNTQTDGSKSIEKLFEEKWKELNGGNPWITLHPGGKNRVARVAIVHNWLSMSADKLPYWIITESNPNLIRTLPMLVYDENKVDDVDTSMEDHAYDDVGYFLSQVKFTQVKPGTHKYKTKPDQLQLPVNKQGAQVAFDPKEFANVYASNSRRYS